MPSMPIVTIGGGSGQRCLLSGLKTVAGIEIRAIVSMVDSGGSTGRLRGALGILPPGDLLKCLLALSNRSEDTKDFLSQRFGHYPNLQGHRVGNMLLAMLARYSGSFPTAIGALAEILDVAGTVLPVTLDRATLVAELADGTRICGESAIDVPHDSQRAAIRDVFLVPHHGDRVTAYPQALDAIRQAAVIVLGPGDLFTSLMANLAVPGIVAALRASRAKLIYVANIMTKFGETHGFGADDFVRVVEQRLGRRVDIVLCNTHRPPSPILARYQRQGASWVAPAVLTHAPPGGRRVYAADLLDTEGDMVRHHPAKLAALLQQILFPDTSDD